MVGVLDHEKFAGQLMPLVERAITSAEIDAVEEMRALVMGITDPQRRNVALSQVERIDVAVQSHRWHRSAAGHVLQATCVDDEARVQDLMPLLNSCSHFLYDWNEDHAEALYQFFACLSDRTLTWASPPNAWRAIVPPKELERPAEALDALTPRSLRKMLEGAEDGDVFSKDDARRIADWYEAMRKAVRIGTRTGGGFFICVEHRD